jgi:hypothetical protein
LVWQCEGWDDRDPICRTVADRCNAYGVGLITFSDACDPRSYATRAAARRHTPEPDLVDGFIETRLPASERDRLAGWIKELQ